MKRIIYFKVFEEMEDVFIVNLLVIIRQRILPAPVFTIKIDKGYFKNIIINY